MAIYICQHWIPSFNKFTNLTCKGTDYQFLIHLSCRKPLIFQTFTIGRNRNHSLKYQRSTTSGSNDIGIRKSSLRWMISSFALVGLKKETFSILLVLNKTISYHQINTRAWSNCFSHFCKLIAIFEPNLRKSPVLTRRHRLTFLYR